MKYDFVHQSLRSWIQEYSNGHILCCLVIISGRPSYHLKIWVLSVMKLLYHRILQYSEMKSLQKTCSIIIDTSVFTPKEQMFSTVPFVNTVYFSIRSPAMTSLQVCRFIFHFKNNNSKVKFRNQTTVNRGERWIAPAHIEASSWLAFRYLSNISFRIFSWRTIEKYVAWNGVLTFCVCEAEVDIIFQIDDCVQWIEVLLVWSLFKQICHHFSQI